MAFRAVQRALRSIPVVAAVLTSGTAAPAIPANIDLLLSSGFSAPAPVYSPSFGANIGTDLHGSLVLENALADDRVAALLNFALPAGNQPRTAADTDLMPASASSLPDDPSSAVPSGLVDRFAFRFSNSDETMVVALPSTFAAGDGPDGATLCNNCVAFAEGIAATEPASLGLMAAGLLILAIGVYLRRHPVQFQLRTADLHAHRRQTHRRRRS